MNQLALLQWTTGPQAWRKFEPEVLLAIAHLAEGGIKDPKDIRDLLGLKGVPVSRIASAVAVAGRIMGGPYPLEHPVRCQGCGGRLVSFPCQLCGPGPGYRKIETPRSGQRR